jgi:hypothetical protein
VFTGDSRPSMMDRGLNRKNTLIDPSSFDRPRIAVVDGDGRPIQEPEPAHRASDKRRSAGPLVNLKDGHSPEAERPGMSTAKTRSSVFGVDTVWQKEQAKLALIEQAEREEAEQRRRDEERKSSKKRKGKKRSTIPQEESTLPEEALQDSRPSTLFLPTLPEVPIVTSRPVPRPRRERDAEGSDGEGHGAPERRRHSAATLGVKGWFAGSSDDEDERQGGPSRGPGGRSSAVPRASSGSRLPPVVDGSDDEDIPLSTHINRVLSTGAVPRHPVPPDDDSEEDEPLVNTKSRLSVAPSTLLDPAKSVLTQSPADDDDDNIPLGLRAPPPGLAPHSPVTGQGSPGGAAEDDDDEKPLGLKVVGAATPEQQRQQQYNRMLLQQQQQQQQQQMYMQQMAQNSIANFPVMGGMMQPSTFGPVFGMTPAPAMFGQAMPMMPHMTGISNPDAGKIGRVDAWRKGVAGGLS